MLSTIVCNGQSQLANEVGSANTNTNTNTNTKSRTDTHTNTTLLIAKPEYHRSSFSAGDGSGGQVHFLTSLQFKSPSQLKHSPSAHVLQHICTRDGHAPLFFDAHIRILAHICDIRDICAYMGEYLLLAHFPVTAWPSLICTAKNTYIHTCSVHTLLDLFSCASSSSLYPGVSN